METFTGYMKPMLLTVSSIDDLARKAVEEVGGSLYPFATDDIDVIIVSLPYESGTVERLPHTNGGIVYKVDLLTRREHIRLHIIRENEHSDELDAHRLKLCFVKREDLPFISLQPKLEDEIRQLLNGIEGL